MWVCRKYFTGHWSISIHRGPEPSDGWGLIHPTNIASNEKWWISVFRFSRENLLGNKGHVPFSLIDERWKLKMYFDPMFWHTTCVETKKSQIWKTAQELKLQHRVFLAEQLCLFLATETKLFFSLAVHFYFNFQKLFSHC